MAVTGPRVGSSAKAETGESSMKAAGAKLGLSVPFKMSQMIGKSVSIKCIMGSAQTKMNGSNATIYFTYSSKVVIDKPGAGIIFNNDGRSTPLPISSPKMAAMYKIENVELSNISFSHGPFLNDNYYGITLNTINNVKPCNSVELSVKGLDIVLILPFIDNRPVNMDPAFYINSSKNVHTNPRDNVIKFYRYIESGKEYEFTIKKHD